MMLCRSGTSVADAKTLQPSRIDVEGLPWPLSVPWSGSFLTSSNPSRDLPAHGIFADIEAEIVPKYRETMIQSYPDIGDLRQNIASLLEFYQKAEFEFPDGIPDPEYDEEMMVYEKPEAILLNERLSASHMRYNSQIEEIIKCCAKQPVMLAHPSGDLDSAVVREAFEDFITVSVVMFSFRFQD